MTDEKTETLKESFQRIVKRETTELMETYLTSKAIGVLLAAWILISFAGSIYRRAAGTCHIKMQINDYVMADLFCPLKE